MWAKKFPTPALVGTELLMEANNFSHVGKKIYSANVINWLLLSL
jgi:hypothetical protein